MNKELIEKSTKELAKQAKLLYGDKLKNVILYGSCARGDFDDESDIDVMVLLDSPIDEIGAEREKLFSIINQIEREFDYEIVMAPVVQSYDVYTKYKTALPFYQNIEREGVVYA